jgi:hypothetical protein
MFREPITETTCGDLVNSQIAEAKRKQDSRAVQGRMSETVQGLEETAQGDSRDRSRATSDSTRKAEIDQEIQETTQGKIDTDQEQETTQGEREKD